MSLHKKNCCTYRHVPSDNESYFSILARGKVSRYTGTQLLDEKRKEVRT